mgnify:CR=1 FL=1|jgi:hypothetical protein
MWKRLDSATPDDATCFRVYRETHSRQQSPYFDTPHFLRLSFAPAFTADAPLGGSCARLRIVLDSTEVRETTLADST